MYSKGLASYGKIANAETDPIKQIVMLYDGAIKFINLTADDIEKSDFVAKAEHSNRALDIINYLQSILNFENGGEVAETLDTLYASVARMMLRASAELDSELMRKSAEMLAPVRDAWEINAQNGSSDQAVPENAAAYSPNAMTGVSMAY
ncbi:MAG: flagellar export chaperone FliS [Pyrinomonadaceae bacterium]|nr:flagellar export chaperone FliS [Pyrinomonadaceae bacterium]